jgi:nucleoside-diphosphate-sugar epimerase
MKALVTGGAGFIGSNLVRELLAGGWDVTVLDNLLSGHRSNLDPVPTARFIEGDIRDEAALEKAIDGADAVFHLAASVGNKRSVDFPLDDADINVMGTIRVLEAMRKAGTKKIVYSSSAGIFGELKTLPIKEDHPIEPDSPYGSTKLCAEKQCLAYSKIYDLDAVCLRYFNVYGPHQRFDAYGNVIPIFVFKLLRGEEITIFGDGEQTRDFINVRDVVRANIAAAEAAGVWGAFNLGSGTRITINHLIDLISEAAGERLRVTYGSPRRGDVRDSLADISAAQSAFGFSPSVEFEEGLRDYVAWARTEVARTQ